MEIDVNIECNVTLFDWSPNRDKISSVDVFSVLFSDLNEKQKH